MSSWSQKYKQSIDCDNPKGFSQKAHCAGKKKSFKEMREYVRGFGTYPGDTMKPMSSLGGYQFFPNRRYATTMPAMSAAYKGAGHGTIKPMVTADTKRIPRKPGQKAKSDKHSDLYTDEDPKGTIHGLGFTDKKKAKQSLSKIRNSGRTHAHKMQAAIAMSQRAKVASQRAKDPEKKKDLGQAHKAYQSYINKNKKSKD
jgi:hypothetical protein